MLIGGVAIVLGCFVEPLEINFMVGQAFAIAAASYFPLLFMSVWWRGHDDEGRGHRHADRRHLGAAGGVADQLLATWAWLPLNEFWAAHPLLRILCEQPAIWAVPGASGSWWSSRN